MLVDDSCMEHHYLDKIRLEDKNLNKSFSKDVHFKKPFDNDFIQISIFLSFLYLINSLSMVFCHFIGRDIAFFIETNFSSIYKLYVWLG